MALTIFEVEVTQITTVRIQFDDAVWTEERMEQFRKEMYPFKTLKRHAEHLAQFAVRFGNVACIEGYGPVENRGDDSNAPEGCAETGVVMAVGETDTDTIAWDRS